jgi:NtrC-family two-component system sensor histidine kinase KinB
MMQATQRISAGQYDVEISTPSRDELGRLTEEFGSMAKKLKAFHDLNIEQIMAEKRKSESIIRSIDDGIILVDGAGRVTDINPMAATIFQVEAENVVNRHFLEVIKSDLLFGYIKESIESGKSARIEEPQRVLAVESNGEKKHYQFSVTPIYRGAGSLLGVALLLRDVTRLAELDRLKGEFLMTASHELRTPLTSVGMSIDLLLESASGKLTGRERELLLAADEDLRRLRALVNNLLDLSRIEAGKIEMDFGRHPVGPLLEKVVDSFKVQAEQQGIILSFRVPEGLPLVRADAQKISRVLTNLVSNALRFTPQGGKIQLVAEAFGPFVQMSVQDSGPGIPYEYQSRIFDKFVQVKDTRVLGGSGLGLAICKEIVRAHGGTIWVDSVPGGGSTFIFTIPAEV